jgi:hypothetical protein
MRHIFGLMRLLLTVTAITFAACLCNPPAAAAQGSRTDELRRHEKVAKSLIADVSRLVWTHTAEAK